MSTEKLLTPLEVCNLLGIRMSKFRSAVFKRELPIIKIGRLIRISQQDLNDWIRQKKTAHAIK